MGYIRTFTGAQVDPLNMKPEDLDILDIAHALSLTCRFGGHSQGFYSVAEHSLTVASNIRGSFKMQRTALLHDAAEAYLGDMVAPVKHGGSFEFYVDAEKKLEAVIAERFDLFFPHPPSIKTHDKLTLHWEQAWVFVKDEGLTPLQAESAFLKEWERVSGTS